MLICLNVNQNYLFDRDSNMHNADHGLSRIGIGVRPPVL
jgi:hypothetical protein